MANTITISGDGLTVDAILCSREAAEAYRDKLSVQIELQWPEPEPEPERGRRKQRHPAVWTPERRAAQAERMREIRKRATK